LRYFSLAGAVSLALLCACAREPVGSALPGTSSTATSRSSPAETTFRLVYSFQGKVNGDGVKPIARLLTAKGDLFGTTEYGGIYDRGTVYEIQPDGTERVLHSFADANGDGSSPHGGLVEHNGKLYGTTFGGGTANHGTVYEIKRDGSLHVIYNFAQSNGANPRGDLVQLFGVFYGTTDAGGEHDLGTVYSLTPDGFHTLVHSFAGGADGAHPQAGLELFNNHLYGTTYGGGAKGAGTIFEISPDGKERIVHDFGMTHEDGANPESRLTVFNGALYGTTRTAGRTCCGTIFELSKEGSESVVHEFSHNEGTGPVAGLTVANGLLYGTAPRAGSKNQGTVFEFNPSGRTFRVVHTFGIRDGSEPRAGLIFHNGKLYGTTAAGGAKSKGVVYEITLSP